VPDSRVPIDSNAAGTPRMLAALVVTLASAAILQQQPAGMVVGQVRSEGTDAPLRFATVEVVLAGRSAGSAVSDSAGMYVLRNVPAGRRVLRVTHFDHAPHEAQIVVPANGEVTLDFVLELRPVRLEAVTARTRAMPQPTGANRDTAGSVPADLGTSSVHVLEATPGVAELGLAEAAREVPGQDPPDPSDVLFVRGGAADLKLVLLDGAPVYAPFHLGGLINAIDVELLSSARLFLGGAPARYDGGLSYVMDLGTRRGREQAHAIASIDLLSTRALMEGPVGPRLTYLLGGRALHGLGGEPFVGDPFPYTYGDGLARIDLDLGRIGHLTGTGFWNRESVRLDTLRSKESAAWGNNAASLRWLARLGGTRMLATAAFGRFGTQLPLGGSPPLITDGSADRARFAFDADYPSGPFRLQFGGSHDRTRYEYRAWAKGSPPDSTLLQSVGEGEVTGGYVDTSLQLGSRVLLRAGMRGDAFSISPGLRLAPRVSATILVTEGSALTLAAGRYRQYVRAPAQSLVFIGTAIPDTVTSPPLAIARANHFVAALDQSLGDGIVLGVEGFYKSYTGVPGTHGGKAEASGVDLWVRGSGGSVNGWLGYSLSWIWTLDQDRIRPTHVFAGRHLMTAGLAGPVPGGGLFEVRFGYGAGLPFTAIPEPEAGTPVFSMAPGSTSPTMAAAEIPGLPAEPDRPFIRLDAQIARTWRSDWRGYDLAVTPYFKVLNALNRRDALFYHVDRGIETTEPRPLAAIPVLPIIGVEWRF
jgi:hypothetical protein